MSQKTRVLLVDDEPNVVEGLALGLRRRFAVSTASSGAEGLEVLCQEPDIAIVVSDMRMPGMDGSAFLARVREKAPRAVRLLLTGHADLDSTIAAVNQGGIFRFLTKPCAAPAFLTALEAADEQHRLQESERVLLEETLRGAIKVLMQVLELASPAAFGRATRLRTLALEVAAAFGMTPSWQLEIAAMLSQIGAFNLPRATIDKLEHGQRLTLGDEAELAKLPEVAERLLASIPRLEEVRAVLLAQKESFGAAGELIPLNARVLRLATDFDQLESQGHPRPRALELLRQGGSCYDARLFPALEKALEARARREDGVQRVPFKSVEVGMILAEEVRSPANGILLVARGFEVTESFLAKARHLPPGFVPDLVSICVKPR